MEFVLNFTPILASFLVSFVTVMLGYFKTTEPENFNLGKFLATLIIGIAVGLLTGLLGWDYTTAEQWLAQGGLTIWIYWFASVLSKKLPSIG